MRYESAGLGLNGAFPKTIVSEFTLAPAHHEKLAVLGSIAASNRQKLAVLGLELVLLASWHNYSGLNGVQWCFELVQEFCGHQGRKQSTSRVWIRV